MKLAFPGRACAWLLGVVVAASALLLPSVPASAADPCAAGGNAVACENSKSGSPKGEWDVGWNSQDIEGYAAGFSYNLGDRVDLKIKTTGSNYRIDVYRMGYYAGAGARKMPITVTPTARTQPSCLTDTTTGLVDCGNWQVSASFTIPTTWVSGVYFAHVVRNDTNAENHIVFVVRNDASTSAMLFQTSDTTWQAYNSWGGNSLYNGQPAGRAYKVSYNRPFNTRDSTPGGRDFVFANEYPMIRFLERNGYDVSYTSGIDSDRRGSLIRNHRMFLTVGHDEYWSGQQRANVEAARDTGVHLAFFAGNDVYWKTRWENAIDGSGNSYRTLVCYKETRDDAKTDVGQPWTGTWRDPRFSPPSDGGRPENALTGTIFTVNSGTRAIKVPAADGKMRLWRNTNVATQAAGGVVTFPTGTLGYEWNSDLDNGARPAGLFRMSDATWDVEEKLVDYGKTVAPGTANHALTMYRASSGARVFSAGTVQWSWGLDSEHDGDAVAADARMQQATVNLFADMTVQPSSLMTGLVAATASADTTPPTAVITAPSSGASLRNGATVTVTGTATDAGGGQVAGVEVSTDNGSSWHPATGRATWSYSYDQKGVGSATIRARAVDDSGNLQSTAAQVSVTAGCPCVLFGASEQPVRAAEVDSTPTELGVRFTSAVNAWVTGVRFLRSTVNTGTHTGTLWSATGTRLATATFTSETTSGWQTVTFTDAVPITAGTQYVVSYFAPAGRYYADPETFAWSAKTAAPLTAPQTTDTAPNGVYRSGSTGFPSSTFKGGNYWVDPVVTTTAPPDTSVPVLTAAEPANGASSVPTSAAPTVTFSETIVASTLAMTLRTSAGATVAGAVSYDPTTRVATFTPTATLAGDTAYTLSVSGARDAAGNTMAPYTGTLRTVKPDGVPGVCPCSIWNDSTLPSTVAVNDAAEVELGVKFRASSDGTITGIRFYKSAQNTGAHTGTLWTATGTQLATGTFSGESSAGWQTLTFTTPVSVAANTTYVASYHTTSGYYSANASGLTSAVTKGPLTALRSGDDGPNGLYRYGVRGFPSVGGGANYWVDVVYQLPPDITAPSVAKLSPANAATGVAPTSSVRITYSEAVATSGITFTLRGPGGAAVPGMGALVPDGTQYLFTPSAPLAEGAVYTATASGAKDAAGNTQTSAVTWSFTTSGANVCPCSLFASDTAPSSPPANDTGAVEVGMKWTPTIDGYVTGVRFFKQTGNTGTHIGNLWSSDGTRLATVTFGAESATGWQTATFDDAVPVLAGRQYTVSYFAPAGRYSADGGFFTTAFTNPPLSAPASSTSGGNGVYIYTATSRYPTDSYNAANYYVDIRFQTVAPADTRAPRLVEVSPANAQTGVPVTTTIRASFDEALQGSGLSMTVTPASGSPVSGLTTYDATTRTVIFSPAAALATNRVHTIQLTGVRDAAGNSTATVTWSFTTGTTSADGCPCTIWPNTATPSVASWNDSAAIEVGVKFRTNRTALVRGVRFYKGATNTGTHIGKLYAADGTELARATFTAESASGWQEVLFATPISVAANTTYVATYYTPTGNYAVTSGGLNAAVTNGPVTALANGTEGPNGLYRYGPGGGFPSAGSGANYWVDVTLD